MQNDFNAYLIAHLTTIEHFLSKVLSEQTKQPIEEIRKEMTDFRKKCYEEYLKALPTNL